MSNRKILLFFMSIMIIGMAWPVIGTKNSVEIDYGVYEKIKSDGIAKVWVYTRNLTHQKLGRFDKVAVLGNQTWAFNFRSTGEPELNGMSGIGRTVNVWEKTNLKASEIRTLVGAFINSTKW